MFEFLERHPVVDVQPAEYRRLLGYPSSQEPDGLAAELAAWAEAWYKEHGRPWIYARQAGGFQVVNGRLKVGGEEFSPTRLCETLHAAGAHDVIAVAVSAGPECEEAARALWEEGKPDNYYFLEVYGSAVVEQLLAAASYRLCAWADDHGVSILPHDSPGYPGWEISEQGKLLSFLRRGQALNVPDALDVLQTGMLRPKKSLLALFGVTESGSRVGDLREMVPCDNCSLPSCRYRRSPYRKPLPRLEAFRRPAGEKSPGGAAPYTFNPRALRKWMEERLELTILGDRSVRARFRYSGTTCSNLGRPLEFDYHVTLGPAEEGYPLREAACAPAPGDAGHTSMCRYIDHGAALMETIARERPLIGRPLPEIFSWSRPFSPSGCYCAPESRDYKWGLVFEVLHYALNGRHQIREHRS